MSILGELIDVPLPAPRKRPRYKGPLIYFVQAESSRAVKIGKTSGYRLRDRISQLQTSTPERLYICRLVRADGHEDLEGAIHRELAEFRIRGEWFRNEGPVMDFAKTRPNFPAIVKIRGRIVSVGGVDVAS